MRTFTRHFACWLADCQDLYDVRARWSRFRVDSVLVRGFEVSGDGVTFLGFCRSLVAPHIIPRVLQIPKTFGCSGRTWTRKSDENRKIASVLFLLSSGVKAWPGAWR